MRTVRTVSEVVSDAGEALAAFGDVWVEGEVSNFVRAASGHLYFSLKDTGATISAAFFARSASRLRFRIENGQKLICRGRLSIYPSRGQFQIIVDHAEPSGIGALTLAFEQLKTRLSAEGLFDAARKKPLPMLPARARPHRMAAAPAPPPRAAPAPASRAMSAYPPSSSTCSADRKSVV